MCRSIIDPCRTLTILALFALAGGVLSACGGEEASVPQRDPARASSSTPTESDSSDTTGGPAASVGRLPASPGTYIALADCTGSFRDAATEYLPEYRAFAQHAAAARGVLRFGCLGGDALTTLRLQTRDFSDAGRTASAVSKKKLRDRLSKAAALGTGARLRAMLSANESTNGSDVYGALEHVASERGITVILLLSDALHAANDGMTLSRASDSELEAFARNTETQMKHLRGVTVLALGVGRGAADNDLARKAERLLRIVVERAGGRLGIGDSVQAAYSSISEVPRAAS